MFRFEIWQSKIGKFVPMKSTRLQPFHSGEILISNCFFAWQQRFPFLWVRFVFEHIDTHVLRSYMRKNLFQICRYLSWNSSRKSCYQIDRDILNRTFCKNIQCSKNTFVRISSPNHSERFVVQCLDSETQTIHSEFRNLCQIFGSNIFRIRFQSDLGNTRKTFLFTENIEDF